MKLLHRYNNLKSGLDQLIIACYNILDLIIFYTIMEAKEVRVRAAKKGINA